VLAIAADEAIFVSAKTGQGLDELYKAIVARIPPPEGDAEAPLRGLIYDAKADVHRGVIVHLRVMDGVVNVGDRVDFMAVGRTHQVTELGKFRPKPKAVKSLAAGEVGYLIGSIKNLADVNIGDTITISTRRTDKPLPGYKAPQQMVFCDFYPARARRRRTPRGAGEAVAHDCSFTYAPASSTPWASAFAAGSWVCCT